MKYYYLNKIAMAVLVALLLFFGTRTLINIAYEEHEPEKPGYEVAGGQGKPGGEAKKAEEPGEEIIAALQTADPAKGEQDVALCKVCHTFDKGGGPLVGPNLYGIVGTKIAEGRGGFNFTPALKKHEGKDWTFQNLDLWLTNPQAFASGTTMAFPGIPDLKKRADVIAYLNKNSDSPLPIPKPKPEEKAPAAAEKPAGAPSGDVAAFLADVATADPKKGESDAMLCKVCHTFNKGGGTLVGPNLYGIVGSPIGEGRGGFSFSPALKKHEGAKWTYENLDAWLTNPQAFAPGTAMAFPGIPDAKKRAAVVAWLRTIAENPVPLPAAAPAAEKPATEEKPAAEQPKAEAPAAPPAEEKPAAEQPKAEEAPAAPATEEKPAAEQPKAEETPAAPAAEAPAAEEKPAAEEPVMEEETMEETIVVPPTVSPDAPHEPSKGEPPSPNQPQPVYPDQAASEQPAGEMMEEEETIVVAPVVSPDAPNEPSKGEPPSANQPQPVYPEGAPAMDDSTGSIAPSADEGLASQPQPVYPDGKPEGL